ncbi:MAG: hypothetical protein C0176_02840 [Mesoaciditoga sp.]|uniref:hypothetical protein n=1 Tax=Athalassotoga sp. TaxID=2022597 RepID=UPI000CABE300|nr:MAG: hypothetical protein C0176_02840 [Mesoaciditoga sp.]HEU24514.1 hypothetical protein [Mesoaciditoga lauensis]
MENNNQNFDFEKYVQAVKSAVEKAPLRSEDSVEVSDIWVITSLPVDLILECLKREEMKLPPTVSKVVFNKRVILKNPEYKGKTEGG